MATATYRPLHPKCNSTEVIEIDGKTLEGGGQLVRNAVCISALTGIPIKIQDIRGRRPSGGGLKAQHVACVNWLAHACSARVVGAEKGSKTLLFEPGKGVRGELPCDHSPAFKKVTDNGHAKYVCRVDCETAGAAALTLQAVLPYILFSHNPSNLPIQLTITGGTNVSFSPSFEYIQHVFLPTLHKIGLPKITATIIRRRWNTVGNTPGEIQLLIPPRENTTLPKFTLRPSDPDAPTPLPLTFQAFFFAPAYIHPHFRNNLNSKISTRFGPNLHTDITCEHSSKIYLIIIATLPSTAPP